MNKGRIEVITAVDVYGDYDQGANVFNENCIIVYGPAPHQHIRVGDLRNRLELLERLEARVRDDT